MNLDDVQRGYLGKLQGWVSARPREKPIGMSSRKYGSTVYVCAYQERGVAGGNGSQEFGGKAEGEIRSVCQAF